MKQIIGVISLAVVAGLSSGSVMAQARVGEGPASVHVRPTIVEPPELRRMQPAQEATAGNVSSEPCETQDPRIPEGFPLERFLSTITRWFPLFPRIP